MKDKKTIWHLPTEPVQERFIIAIIDEKLYPFFGVYYLDEGSYFTNRQDWSDVEKWCFLDDLLEQSSKIERLEDVICDIYSTLNLVMNDSVLRTSDDGFTLLYKLKAKITQALKKASQ